jgi:hypothetical protein
MGQIFSPNWEKKPRVIRRRYLGFGHWIVLYSDGIKELEVVSSAESKKFYNAEDWTDEGFPVLEGRKLGEWEVYH